MDPVQLYSILGVLAILLGVIAYNNVMAAKAARVRTDPASGPASETWVGRYVQFEGEVVGQVVAEKEGMLILRKGSDTLGVPRNHARPQGLDLGLKEFDANAARAAGAEWRATDEAAP